MRGRLIFPFLAGLYRLDTAGTEAVGYDKRFRAPTVQRPVGPEGARKGSRRELAEIRLPCQVETENVEKQRQGPGGNMPDGKIWLVFHFSALEVLGLVDANGDAKLRVNDRLDAIYTKTGALERRFADPPGMYCVEARPIAFGIGGRKNLLLVTFDDRVQGLTQAP
jgi:hypothetical protein